MKNKLFAIILVVAMLLLTSCADVKLEKKQSGEGSDNSVYSSKAEADSQSNENYTSDTQTYSSAKGDTADSRGNTASDNKSNSSVAYSSNNNNSSGVNSSTAKPNVDNSSKQSSSSWQTVGGDVPAEATTEIYTGGAVNPKKYDVNAEYSGAKTNLKNAQLFNAEGYGKNVTGGGNLSESSSDYYKVTNADEFIRAINRKNTTNKDDSGWSTRPTVIEVMNDIDLGWNNIGTKYSDIVTAKPASTSPALKESGVSLVYITGRQNLTIFSKNGYELKHACFQVRALDSTQTTNNVIIRNIAFRGPWEWDDSGEYDDNDWDIFTIRADKGEVKDIWFDHCTFYKSYDGTVDIKDAAKNITVSWCAFLPHDMSDPDFKSMMDELESNRASYPNYNAARNGGATVQDMIEYAMINKKTHLVGASDKDTCDVAIRVTYCYNYYYDCTERLPRLRYGKAHVYNCVFNASRANALKNSIKTRKISWPTQLSFASNGSLGTDSCQLLVENCYIDGINTPLRNNNKKVGAQFDGAIDALYTYYTVENIDRSWKFDSTTKTAVSYSGRYAFLGHSTKTDGNLMQPFPTKPLSFDTDAFKSQLGYEYVLYKPFDLGAVLSGNVGAGKMKISAESWLRSSYSADTVFSDNAVKAEGVSGSTANLNAKRA